MKTELLELIKELTANGVLKNKVNFSAPNYGSSCDKNKEVTLYWNESKLEWTSSKQFAMPHIKETV